MAMDLDHTAVVLKARGASPIDRKVITTPDVAWGKALYELLQTGSEKAAGALKNVTLYPKTKIGFLNWVKDTMYKGDAPDNEVVGNRIKEILESATMAFNIEDWEVMQETIQEHWWKQ